MSRTIEYIINKVTIYNLLKTLESLSMSFKKLLSLFGGGNKPISTKKDVNSTLNVNEFSSQALQRSELFESITTKEGCKPIKGRFGGEYNNDQLAMLVQDDGKVTLMLGLKISDNGNVQLDNMSMGGFQQFSEKWLLAVLEYLKNSDNDINISEQLALAWKTNKLILGLLCMDKNDASVIIIRVETPLLS